MRMCHVPFGRPVGSWLAMYTPSVVHVAPEQLHRTSSNSAAVLNAIVTGERLDSGERRVGYFLLGILRHSGQLQDLKVVGDTARSPAQLSFSGTCSRIAPCNLSTEGKCRNYNVPR
jgi:hypothetical protein